MAEAMADIGLWWETRQQRLVDAASFEEERRLPWTLDMMERWVAAHRDGQHVDLQVSSFLARETNATLRALVENKKMAMPQSMLYDLELMRQTLTSVRQLFLVQFEELHASPLDDDLPLNMSFIRRLGSDPAEDWLKSIRDRATDTFAQDLKALAEDRDLFLKELFADHLPAIPTEVTTSTLARLTSRLAEFADMAGGLLEPIRAASAARRNEYRELALFSAEVVRASALHSAWGVLSDFVKNRHGISLVGVEVDGELSLRSVERPLEAISAGSGSQRALGGSGKS